VHCSALKLWILLVLLVVLYGHRLIKLRWLSFGMLRLVVW
jgi:hypothetical protein